MLFGLMILGLAGESEYSASLELRLVEVLPDPEREKTLPSSFACSAWRAFAPSGLRLSEVRTNVFCTAFVVGGPIDDEIVERARNWEASSFAAVGCYLATSIQGGPSTGARGLIQRKANRQGRRSSKAAISAFDSRESCVPDSWSWTTGKSEQFIGQVQVSTSVERVEADWETALRIKREFGDEMELRGP